MELRLLKMNQSDIEAALLSSLNEELRITKIINQLYAKVRWEIDNHGRLLQTPNQSAASDDPPL